MAEEREATPEGAGGASVDARDLDDAREQSLASREILLALGRAGRQLRPDPRHHRRARAAAVPRRRRAARTSSTETSSGCPGSRATCPRSSGATCGSTPSSAAGPRSSAGSPRTGGPSRSPTCSATRSTAGRTSSGSPASAPCCRRRCCWATRSWASSPMWRTEVAPVQRAGHAAAGRLRGPGGHRAAAGRPDALARGARRRAGQQGRAARGAARAGRGGQLEPRPRRGAQPHRHQRRAAHRHRRRLDHGVRRGRPTRSSSAPPTARAQALVAELRATTIRRDSTLVGRAATERRPLEVSRPSTRPTLDPHLESLYRDGWRSVLAIPMLRGDLIVGVLVIRRRSVGAVPRGHGGPAADLRVPVLGGHRQRAAVPRAGAEGRAAGSRARGRRSDQPSLDLLPRSSRPSPPSSRWPASTSRSSWPACPTSSARR